MADVSQQTYRALPRPGDVKLSLVAADHDGWILLDGRQTLVRTELPSLFDAIGTRYGAGDGKRTFGIPKACDGFLMAAGPGHALGTTGGSENHTLTVDELPPHDHLYSKTSKVAGGLKLNTGGILPVTVLSDLQSTDTSTGKAGAAKPFALLPPFLALNAFVYAGL